MSQLPPLAGLTYIYRHKNERFNRLCSIAMEKDVQRLKNSLQAEDLLYDPETKVSLLQMAAASGSREILQYLLNEGLMINGQDIQGNTPLHFAALSGYKEGITFLLDHGADKSLKNKWGQAPWQVAKTAKLVNQLCPDENIKLPQKSLREAVETEDIVTVKHLLELGVHPNLLNEGSYQVEFSLLLHIAIDSKNLELVQLLLEHGADPTAPGLYSRVPLEMAINQENVEMVRLLLQYNANPNGAKHDSLLHLATRNNLLEIMELLLKAGADPEVQLPTFSFYYPPLRDAKSVEAIRILLKHGAKTDPELMGKFNFLIWPIDFGYTDVVREFIRIGVPLNNGGLWDTAIKGTYKPEEMVPICKLLLENGLDVNLPIFYYGKPLIRAIRHSRNYELVKLMLEYGADLEATDPNGRTPYEVAMSILEIDISNLIASQMNKVGIRVPIFQQTPSLSQVEAAMKQDHTDLIQASYYSSGGSPNHQQQFKTLKKLLDYSKQSLPLYINAENDEEYEEWDEEYEPSLSGYYVVFHPHDPRCFILIVSWYDEYAYSFLYHIHVRCEATYSQEINQLFANWSPDYDEEELTEDEIYFLKRYKHGHFYVDWKQNELSEELLEIRDEAENYYVEAVKEIQIKTSSGVERHD